VTEELDQSFALQAAAIVGRWRGRAPRTQLEPTVVPDRAALPALAEDRLRSMAWVVHEQRLAGLLLAALIAATVMVWLAAVDLAHKPALVVRAGPGLKEAAQAFNRRPELAYDQLAFFLHGCVPLLYASQSGRSPLLPLAEGLVAPEICRDAERRLAAHQAAMAAQGMSQALTLTEIVNVASDVGAGRAAAELAGYLTVTTRQGQARSFPWRGRAVIAANPGSRLDPYPFYLLSLEAASAPP
jgi:hypothetical protein